MNCFNGRSSVSVTDCCCNGNELCKFSGNLDEVESVPIYTQYVYDAVQSNLQGMKSVQNQTFSPAIPCGFTVSRICDIRTKAFFNPCNIDDPRNLTVDTDTALSGASYLQDCHGEPVCVTGPDGLSTQKILYVDDNNCPEGSGTPVFGTQNVSIHGNVKVYIDLILCNNCNHETKFTVCADVPVATAANPVVLTNFFELCVPAETDTAFLPRFTEISCISTEARLATNNCGRDLNINSNGEIYGNLIIALCVSTEKKVTGPVQACVLSTGAAAVPAQTNTICSGFPSMFAGGITAPENNNSCGCADHSVTNTVPGCCDPCEHDHDYNVDCGCNTKVCR